MHKIRFRSSFNFCTDYQLERKNLYRELTFKNSTESNSFLRKPYINRNQKLKPKHIWKLKCYLRH